MKIVTVLGARPQFIKAAMLSKVLNSRTDIQEIIVHTGQHFDTNMSSIFFEEMQIPKPHHHLQVTSKLHGEMTGRMLEKIEQVLIQENPDLVLVYGDTNSTLAGALAAVKLHTPVAHIEAGLRSFNKLMPEERNRVLTDHISEFLFAPTKKAAANLQDEGIKSDNIFIVGDIMNDALQFYRKLAEEKSTVVEQLGLQGKHFLLATVHRAENTNSKERVNSIFEQLQRVAERKVVVLPLHPRTKNYLTKDYSSENFKIIPPVGYFDMISLQANCKIVVTDSGGIQKEAYLNQKYCITIRDETEWIELVEHNYNFLARPIDRLEKLVNDLWDKKFIKSGLNLYGDGNTASKILSTLEKFL